MNCRKALDQILAHRENPAESLPSDGALARHLAACPECRQTARDMMAVINSWQEETAQVSVPDATAAWASIRARRHRPAESVRRRTPPLFWLALPLAAAAALAVIFQPSSAPAPDLARAEFVEAGNADASTMVYVDKESGWLVVWASESPRNTSG